MLRKIAAAAMILFLPTLLPAQTTNARITGFVTDPSKAVIVGAKVGVINMDTNLRYTTRTNEEGSYAVSALSPGNYKIEVEKQGFNSIVKSDVVLHVQDAVAINFQMAIGSVSESVTVKSGAPMVNTQSAAVGTVVTREQVENMPLNGRSFQSLITLTPGVVLTPSGGASPGQFSTDGQRAYSNYFTLDGVSANFGTNSSSFNSSGFAGAQPALTAQGTTQGIVSVDALEEFRVQTSNYAPEFGRTPGAQVALVTRSGTNQFHGTLFEYLRNDVFDANDWFANSRRLPTPPLRQNDFGGTFGGPVLLPEYNGRDHTFFFFSYEGLRLRQPQFSIQTVPSSATRQATAATLRPLLDGFPKPNGPDPLLNPTTGRPTDFAEFDDSHSDPSTINATSIRIDHTFNHRFLLFGRYTDSRSMAASRFLSSVSSNPGNTQMATVGATMTLASNVVNELRWNFSRGESGAIRTLDNFGGAIPPPDSALFPPPFASSKDSTFSFLFLGSGGFSQLPAGTDAAHLQRQVNLVDSLSMMRCAHAMKFGVDYRRLLPVIGPSKYGLSPFASGLSDLSAGKVIFARISSQLTNIKPVFVNWSLFAQDSWRVNRRLTLTYGLRWELNPAPHNADGPAPPVLTGLDTPANFALAPQGTPLYPTRYNNFAPRFGAAGQLRQSTGWETVVRGGLGVFYDLGSSEATSGFFGTPFTAFASVCCEMPYPLTTAQLTPPTASLTPPLSGKFFAYDPENFNLPYTVQWNFALQQALGQDQVLTATYVGNLGRRYLGQQFFLTPNQNFALRTPVTVFRSSSTSDYHALQLQFQRRMSHGLQALASYTWSHAIDDTSNDNAISTVLGSSRGNSNSDLRHRFAASLSYKIPSPRGRIARAILGNWGVDTIFQAQSALPVGLQVRVGGLVVNGESVQVTRPDIVPGVPVSLNDPTVPGHRRFNNAAFTPPPIDPKTRVPLRQGTLARNALRGLPLSQMDFGLRRQFSLTERLKLHFRTEAFNLFNHPNFGALNNTVGSPTLGVPTTMLGRALGGLSPLYQVGGPRSLQLSLRLAF